MTKRRGRGEGSVYRWKDGRCVGEYEDTNGKRRYVSGKTKAEVRAKLRKLLADRDEGIAYDSENLTVSGYLDRWIDWLIRPTPRPCSLAPAVTTPRYTTTVSKALRQPLRARTFGDRPEQFRRIPLSANPGQLDEWRTNSQPLEQHQLDLRLLSQRGAEA